MSQRMWAVAGLGAAILTFLVAVALCAAAAEADRRYLELSRRLQPDVGVEP